jgi:hypothetical protein
VRRDIVAFYNWDKERAEISTTPERIGLPPAKEYVAFDFWANKFVPPFSGQLTSSLSGQSSRILAVRPVSEFPQLLSTSRHVTQGIIDVTDEKWDAAKSHLSATSKVVANDPYELRIVVPSAEKSWRANTVKVSAEDSAAGVKAEIKQDSPRIRANITSPVSRDVKWTFAFERGQAIDILPPPVANLKANVEYNLITLSWTDSGAAAAVSIEVTPETTLKAPPIPPLPTVYLDATNTKFVQNTAGQARFGPSYNNNKLSLDGKAYDKGIGTHTKALAVATIPKEERSSVVFEVYGDVLEMGEKPVLLAQSPVLTAKGLGSWNFNVELNARFKEVRLVVTDAGNGIASDHADWVNAEIHHIFRALKINSDLRNAIGSGV